MRTACYALSLTMLLGLAACSSTPCDEALDKVESCGLEGFTLNDAGEECGAFAECQAECVIDASCNDIRGAVDAEENALTECLFQCGE
ncbi:MAG: hypothetical protein HOW73_39740 [Polyangiaceae bacterium]|nr:hypothetical protein [Polyangiaceae bacterium]